MTSFQQAKFELGLFLSFPKLFEPLVDWLLINKQILQVPGLCGTPLFFETFQANL